MPDETYIKMVRALPESFFDGWEWKAGDKLISDSIIYTVIGGNKSGALVIGEDMSLSSTNNLNFGALLRDSRPLPSQKQLQETILNHWKKNAWAGYTYLQLLSEFRLFIFEKSDIKRLIEEKITICEMWLMFLMYDLYKKRWNGESWV
jgi:hypothetical protein